MEEALKNPHYKKIWEKIIMNRHPEAKSLEEALGMEISPFNGCMVLVDLTQLGYIMSTNEPLKVVSYNKFEYFAIEPVYSKLVRVWDTRKKKVQNNSQILGRPINLEDILLQYNLSYYDDCIIDLYKTGGSYDYDGPICAWQLTKPLHEQTPETWEKISNVIN